MTTRLAALALLLPAALQGESGAPPPGLDPAAARLSAARAAYAARELGRARDLLGAALEEAPEEPEVRLWLGRVLNDLGRGREAQGVLGPALEKLSRSAWLLTESARAARLERDLRGAEDLLRAALEVYPRCGPARLYLADLLLEGGRAQQAQEVIAPLRDQAPDDSAAAVLAARVALALGRAAQAEGILRARLAAAGPEPAPRLALGRVLLEAGRAEEAWDVLEPLLEAEPDPQVLLFLARAAQRAGRPIEALAALGAALLVDPTGDDVLRELAELIEHEGDLHLRLTRRRVQARPGDAEAWRELLEAELDAGRAAAALDALGGAPREVRAVAAVRLVEGEALRRAGRTDAARELLEALCDEGGGARAWYELGLLEYAAGSAERAALAFERGADGPWAGEAHFNRGVCLERLGRQAEAARAYEAAVAVQPDFCQAWLQLGLCLRGRLGDAEGARGAFARYLELGGDDPEIRRWMEVER